MTIDDTDDDLFDTPIPRKPKPPSSKIVYQPAGVQWSLDRLPEVETAYQTAFKKRLPLTNRGQGSIHNKWGYDHRNSADVSINPSTPEGQQFIEQLKSANIPFLAFTQAIPGVATGPHVHIGHPSKKTSQRFGVGAQRKKVSVASDDLFDKDDDLFESAPTTGGRGAAMARLAQAKPGGRRGTSQQRLEVGGKTGGQPATSPADLRRLDAPEVERITRYQKQVADNQPMIARVQPRVVAQTAAKLASQESKQAAKRQASEPQLRRLTDFYRKQIVEAGKVGVGPTQWVQEMMAKGAGGLVEYGAAAVRGLSPVTALTATLLGNREKDADTVALHAEAMQRAAQEAGADRNELSKIVQDVAAGTISTAPEMAAMVSGVPAPAVMATGAASRSIGRGETPQQTMDAARHGAATGTVFQGPMGQSMSGVKRLLTRAGSVGAGTATVDLASGATPTEALKSGAINAITEGVTGKRAPKGETLTTVPDIDATLAKRESIQPTFLRNDAGEPVARVLNPDEVAQGAKPKVRAIHQADTQVRDPTGKFAPKEPTPDISIPERVETIQAQLDAVKQGTRPAVLITEGTQHPAIPRGLSAVRTKAGVFYFDPKQVDAATLRAKVADGTYGELLGHVEAKSEATTEAVVARAPDGTEVQASAVSPENVSKQAEVLAAQHANAEIETGGPELAEQVITERLQGDRRSPQRVPEADWLEMGEAERAKVRGEVDLEQQYGRPEGGKPVVDIHSGEVPQSGRSATSIKNAATEELRKELELTEMERPERKSWETAINNAQAKGLNADVIAEKVLAGDREVGLDYEESAALLIKIRELENQWEAAYRKDPNSKEVADIKFHLDKLSQAVDVGGTEPARALSFRRAMADKDFKLINLVRAVEKGRERAVTPKELARYDAIIKERDSALAEVERLKAAGGPKPALDKFVREQQLQVRRTGRARQQSDLLTERAELKQQIAQAWAQVKPKTTTLGSAGIGDLDAKATAELTRLLTKMARNYIESGVIKAVDLVDAIHADVKDATDLSKREVSDLISGYGRIRQPTTDRVETKLNEIKSILAATSGKADVLEQSIRPARRGQQREKPTEDQRRALRELNEAMRERGPQLAKSPHDPTTQQATPLDKAKSTVRNRIEQLEKWLKDGRREAEGRSKVIPDAELKQLQAERAGLERAARMLDDPATDQKAVEKRLGEIRKSMSELQEQVRTGKVSKEPKEGAYSRWSEEIGQLEQERQALRRIASDMRGEAARKAREQPTDKAHFYGAEQSWADFEKEARRSLARVKQLDARAKELERKTAAGEFGESDKPPSPTYNADVRRAEQRVAAAEAKYKREMDKAKPGYLGRQAIDTLNVAKTLKSSIDLSAPRQAAMWMINHPVQGTKLFFGKQLRAMKGKNFDEFARELEADPDYKLMRDSELALTTTEKDMPLNQREEAFMSKLAGKIPGVKHSERAYTTFLDTARVSWFKQMKAAAEIKAKAEGRKLDTKDYKAISNFINIATGRGNLGKGKLNHISPVLNALFFAPKYAASKVQVFDPRVYARLPSGARKIAMREAAVHFGAMTATALLLKYGLGVSVGLNPEDSEFMKARWGDTRYDLSNGTGQYVTLAARLMRNAANKATGEKDPYGRSISQNIDRFLRYKYSPPAAFVRNVWEGKNPVGKETSLGNEAVQLISPLFVNEMREAFQAEGLAGMAKTTPSFIGIGTSTYPDRAPTPAQKRSGYTERLRKGELSVDQLQDEVDRGGLTVADRKAIEKYGGMTPFQEAFSKAFPSTAIDRFERMSPQQRTDVENIMQQKAKSLVSSDSLTDAQKEAYRERLLKLGIVPEE